MSTDWKELNHIIPPDMEQYVVMLCEAGSAKNEVVLLTRFQKVVRLIYDERIAPLERQKNEKEKHSTE